MGTEEEGGRREDDGPGLDPLALDISADASAAGSVAPRRASVFTRMVVSVVLTVATLAAIGIVIIMAFTTTDWGRERIRQFAETRLQSLIHGRLQIGKITGSVLTGVTIHDVVISDSGGHPLIAVSAIRGEYRLWDVLHRRIWINNAVLVRPVILIDRPPTGDWNWHQILFFRDTVGHVPKAQPSWGDWVRLTDLKVIDGDIVIRAPWHPSRRLKTGPALDSAIRVALSGDARTVVEQVPGGFQKVVRLRSVTATIPLLRITDPAYKTRLALISSLAMQALPFRPPAADIVNVQGGFSFNNDSIWWKGADVHLTHTALVGDGSYLFKSGDLTLNTRTSTGTTGDFRWIFPQWPANGVGAVDFALTWRDTADDYLATHINFSLGDARVTGSFGMWRADSTRYHDTDIHFTNLDTRVVEQFVTGFTSPRQGVVTGHTAFSGGIGALAIDWDVTFADARGAGTSRMLARGELGFLAHGIRARDLHLQLRPVQIALARALAPTLPIAGVVTGAATVNGSTTTELRIVADLDHEDGGMRSAFSGSVLLSGSGLRTGESGKVRFHVDALAHPVSLGEAGLFFPSAGLQGTATGPIRLNGTLADFDLDTDVRLADGGEFAAKGQLALTGPTKQYDLTAAIHTFDLQAVLAKAPQTNLTATAIVRGSGIDLATMNTTLAAELATSQWDSLVVDTASIRATLRNGRAEIAQLDARAMHVTANASGTFGMVAGQTGTLAYRVAVDSLGALNRWIPGVAGDTGVVAPRPGLVAQALRAARADSARIAKKTEVERYVTGKAPPTLAVTMPRTVRRDTVGGVLYASGTLSGNLTDFDARGRAGGENLTARGDFVRRFTSEYAWTHVRTPQARAVFGVDADSVMAFGFAFDTVSARVSYASANGHAELLVRQGATHDYSVLGDFSLSEDDNEARIADLRVRLDSALWSAPHPASIRWGGPGIELTDFELANRTNGRIYANGMLPTEGVANFSLSVAELPVADLLDLAQSDIELQGSLTLAGRMNGTLTNPTFSGAFGLANATYHGDSLPQRVKGTFQYADRALGATLTAARDIAVAPMFVVDAHLPINLALSGVTGSRLLDEPMTVDLAADSLPLDLIPQVTDAVSNLHGLAVGKVAMRGRLKQPELNGGLVLIDGSVTIGTTGQTVDHLNGNIRMEHDTVFLGDRALAGQTSGAGLSGLSRDSVTLGGTIAVGNWRDPMFNLSLLEKNAEVLHSDSYGRMRADVSLAFTGPLSDGDLRGSVTVREGVIQVPGSNGRHIIAAGDPAILAVLDTAIASDRALFPQQSAFWRSMQVDVRVEIRRNTWVRTHDANVEIYTDYPLLVRVQNEALGLTGVVTTDRGEYTFMSKRFQIKRGSAMFVGTPGLNPSLQVTGEYEVKTPSAVPVAITVLIGGTLHQPRLTLESNAQPPRSQSELLSLLAFGEPTSSLLALQGSSIASVGGGSDLVGQNAGLAVHRMAGVAMGVAVDQLETQAGKRLGTDYFNITPADVPTALQSQGFSSFLTETSIELGKYLNPRTFLSVQTVGVTPGAAVQYRTPKGWQYELNSQPQILLVDPSLSQQVIRTRQSFGALIFKEWSW